MLQLGATAEPGVTIGKAAKLRRLRFVRGRSLPFQKQAQHHYTDERDPPALCAGQATVTSWSG